MTKLTLSLDEKVIKKAKIMAKKNNTSVSKMASDYFEAMSSMHEESSKTPMVNEMIGLLSGRGKNRDVRAEYRGHLEKKYR